MKTFGKMIVIGVACLAASCVSTYTLAQKPHKLIKKGQEYFFRQEFKPALEYFQQALDAAPNDAEALLFTGAAMQFLGMEKKGLGYIQAISEEHGKTIPNFYYWKAFVLYKNEHFSDAATNISLQLSSQDNTLIEPSQKLKQSIQQAQKLHSTPNETYIENLGQTINTIAPEYSAVLTADHRTINFTSKRQENKGGKVEGGFREDILVSSLDEHDQWSKPHNLDRITTLKNDATVQLFGNDKEMLIYQEGDLFITRWTGDEWTNLKSISNNINSPKSRETHAFITKSGKKMIYCSDRGTQNDDLDLFISYKKDDGNWGAGVPISNLNTREDEDAPFIAADGTLYFSSKGHNSMGGFDIFKSEYDESTQKYMPPVNMGVPINSVGNDIFFNLKNKIAYFTSDRPGGFGATDIYRAYLFRNVILSGTVFGKGKIPLSDVELVFVSAKKEIRKATTDAKGNYRLNIPFFETYTATITYDHKELLTERFKPKVSLRNPEIARKDFHIDATKKMEVDKEIDMLAVKSSEIAKADIIKGIVTDKETGTPLAATIKMVDPKDGNVIEEMSLSENGQFSFQISSSFKHVAFQAHHAGYFSGEQEWKRAQHKGETFEIKLASASKGKRLSTNRIYFDFNKATIRDESRAELLKIVEFFKANPSKLVEIGGHTDNVGSDDYNQSLSERRAISVKQFLVEHGIEATVMTTVGYGESQPIASNDDEESGRELNRRIEFKIL